MGKKGWRKKSRIYILENWHNFFKSDIVFLYHSTLCPIRRLWHLTFFPVDVFYRSTLCPIQRLLHSTLFPVDIFYFLTFCPVQRLLPSFICPFVVIYHSTLCPFDVFYYSTFSPSTLCTIRRLVHRRFLLSAFSSMLKTSAYQFPDVYV
jgi:hypothetical protein